MSLLRISIVIAGLILFGVNGYLYAVSEQGQFIFFLLGIIVLGIPHGGADLLIASQNSRNSQRKFSKAKFNLMYLGNIALFLVLLLSFPSLGLMLFLLLAAYHFGETDLQGFITESLAGDIFMFTYGMFILGLIFLPDFDKIYKGLERLHPDVRTVQVLEWINIYNTVILGVVSFSFIAIGSLYFFYNKHLFKLHWHQLILLSLLSIIVYKLPLLLSFSFYFVVWHSLISLNNIICYLLLDKSVSPVLLVKETLTNSLIALIGVSVLGWAAFSMLNNSDLILYTVVGLAVLTAPHMQVMHRMYRQLD